MRNSFFDIDNWKEIIATLARNKTRTFLTAFGIFWGTAMLTMLWGGAQGLQGIMRGQLAGFATNVAFIFADVTSMPYKGYNKGMSWDLTLTDLNNMRDRIPQINALTAVQSRYAMTATFGSKHTSTTLQGVESSYSRINEPLIYEGRFLNQSDDSNERKVCVLGQRVATDLFGSQSPIGKSVAVNNIYYRVVGVCGQRSEVQINVRLDESIVIPYATMKRAYNLGEAIDGAMLLFDNNSRPADIRPAIEHVIRTSHPIHPEDRKAIAFFDISEMFEMVDNLFLGISILAIFVGASTLIAGIIGVGNIMWVIVKERTPEIGIRRAIGARPKDIIMQVLSESVTLTIIAGIAGICFAVIILVIAELITGSNFLLSFNEAITIMFSFLVLGTLAGSIPAIKAMKIKPIEAINDK